MTKADLVFFTLTILLTGLVAISIDQYGRSGRMYPSCELPGIDC